MEESTPSSQTTHSDIDTPAITHSRFPKTVIIVALIVISILGLYLGVRFQQNKASLTNNTNIGQRINKNASLNKTQILGVIPPGGDVNNCIFSKSGNKYACIRTYEIMSTTSKYGAFEVSILSNGEETERYDEIGEIRFSPNDDKLVYTAKKDGKQFLVFDDKKGKEYETRSYESSIIKLTFSPDGKHFAYIVGEQLSDRGPFDYSWDPEPLYSYAVVDGVQGKKHEITLNNIFFTADNKSVFLTGFRGTKYTMFVNDEEVLQSSIPLNGPFFNSTGSIFAYQFTSGENINKIIVFGKAGEKMSEKDGPENDGKLAAINPDGSKFLYIVNPYDHPKRGLNNDNLYLNNEKVFESDLIENPIFVNNGLGYILDTKNSAFSHIILNGAKILYDSTEKSDYEFGADGEIVARLGSYVYNHKPIIDLIFTDGKRFCHNIYKGSIPFLRVSDWSGTYSTAMMQKPIFDNKSKNISFGYINSNQLIWQTEKIDMNICPSY